MDENKSMSLAVLGVVAVIAVVSVVLLLTNSQTTGLNVGIGDKTYGGAAREPDRYYDVQADRLVNGKDGFGTERAAAEGTPYRTYVRARSENPSLLTSCGPDLVEKDFKDARTLKSRYGVDCLKLNGDPDGRYCCPDINLAKGEVEE